MTPEQDAMLSYVFAATLGFEIALLIIFAAIIVSAVIGWVRKLISRRRERREMHVPRHGRQD